MYTADIRKRHHFQHQKNICRIRILSSAAELCKHIAPDKAAYCVFTQLLGPKKAIQYKNAIKILDTQFRTFHSVLRYSIRFVVAVFAYNKSNCWVQIYTRHGTESSILNFKPVQDLSYCSLAYPIFIQL